MSGGPSTHLRGWFDRERGAVRAAIRMTIAGGLAFVVPTLLHLPSPYWAVMTAILVIQSTVGASLASSLDRLAGTIGGVIVGALVGWLVPSTEPAAVLFALILTLLPLTLLASISSRYKIAPITAVITLIIPHNIGSDAFVFALDRVVEVAIGGVIAIIVSLVVLPSRGHQLFAGSAAAVFRALADVVPQLASQAVDGRADDVHLSDMLAAVDNAMSKLDDAATETRREARLKLSSDPDPDALLLLVGRMRNDAMMLFRSTGRPLSGAPGEQLAPMLTAVAKEASAYLVALATAMESDSPIPAPDDVQKALTLYREEITKVRSAGLSAALSVAEVERLFTLGFALEQMGDDLVSLAKQCAAFVRPA